MRVSGKDHLLSLLAGLAVCEAGVEMLEKSAFKHCCSYFLEKKTNKKSIDLKNLAKAMANVPLTQAFELLLSSW